MYIVHALNCANNIIYSSVMYIMYLCACILLEHHTSDSTRAQSTMLDVHSYTVEQLKAIALNIVIS